MLNHPPPAGADPKRPERPKRIWPWYRPVLRNWRRYYLRQFPRKKKLHGTLLHRILGNRLFDPGLWLPTRDTVAWGMAIGVFVGLMPFLGLQIVLSILLCFAFRVNVTAAVVATFISNPFTAAPILYLQRLVGMKLAGPVDPAELEMYTGFAKGWVAYGKPVMLGAVVTGAAAAVVSYVLTLVLWSMFSKAAGKAIAARHAKKHAAEAHAGGSDPAAHPPADPETPGQAVPGVSGDPFASGEAKKD